MKPLKTLKDLPKYFHGEELEAPPRVSIDELKAEAVKWVKEENRKWKKALDNKKLKASFPNSPRTGLFIEFHNITSEDLK